MNAPTALYPSTHTSARDRWALDAATVVLGLASVQRDEPLREAVRVYLGALVAWLDVAALWGASTVAYQDDALTAYRTAWESTWHRFHDVTLDASTDPGAQAHELVGGALFVAVGFTARELVALVATLEHPHDRERYCSPVRYLAATYTASAAQ